MLIKPVCQIRGTVSRMSSLHSKEMNTWNTCLIHCLKYEDVETIHYFQTVSRKRTFVIIYCFWIKLYNQELFFICHSSLTWGTETWFQWFTLWYISLGSGKSRRLRLRPDNCKRDSKYSVNFGHTDTVSVIHHSKLLSVYFYLCTLTRKTKYFAFHKIKQTWCAICRLSFNEIHSDTHQKMNCNLVNTCHTNMRHMSKHWNVRF